MEEGNLSGNSGQGRSGRKGETKAFTWSEYRDLLIAAHRQLPGGNIVLVWDNLNVHLRAELRAFAAAQAWLRVFRLPSYAPGLNPLEGIWSVIKGGVLANLATAGFSHLVQVIRHGLKKIQYRPRLIEGCLAGTGLTGIRLELRSARPAGLPLQAASGLLPSGTQRNWTADRLGVTLRDQ